MTDANAAVFSASNENAGPTRTGSGSGRSQTNTGTRSSQPSKAQPSTSTQQSRAAGSANTNAQTNGSKPSETRLSGSGSFSEGTWAAMTPAEEKMYKRLASRHRLIRLHGAKAAEMLEAEEALKARRAEWVARHNLACFKCHTKFADEWVAGGKRADGSLWVACKCIWQRNKAGP